MCLNSPITNIPLQSGSVNIADEFTLTHHDQLKFTVYISVYFWYYAFFGYEQMYKHLS
jgi:hypothetical protein